jgi:hypothetical protein
MWGLYGWAWLGAQRPGGCQASTLAGVTGEHADRLVVPGQATFREEY